MNSYRRLTTLLITGILPDQWEHFVVPSTIQHTTLDPSFVRRFSDSDSCHTILMGKVFGSLGDIDIAIFEMTPDRQLFQAPLADLFLYPVIRHVDLHYAWTFLKHFALFRYFRSVERAVRSKEIQRLRQVSVSHPRINPWASWRKLT
jgi:hypothetical protein